MYTDVCNIKNIWFNIKTIIIDICTYLDTTIWFLVFWKLRLKVMHVNVTDHPVSPTQTPTLPFVYYDIIFPGLDVFTICSSTPKMPALYTQSQAVIKSQHPREDDFM